MFYKGNMLIRGEAAMRFQSFAGWRRGRRTGSSCTARTLVAAGLAGLVFAAAPVRAEGPFASLTGSWNGSGNVKFAGGQSEPIKCKLYYNPKGGTEVSLALRCASTSAKIEMRANLVANGGSVSGTWEERSYNATGSVSGKASTNTLSMHIEGGGLTGTMNVNVNGSSQSVSITTSGAGFTGINLNFSKG